MKQAMEIIQGMLAKGFSEVDGECPQHGASKRLVRDGEAWSCSKCLEAEIAATGRAQWLAERQEGLMKISHIPSKFVGKRWPVATPEHAAARMMVARFRDFILSNKEWAALIMTGKTGTGKTWLASEFAEALIRRLGLSVRYVTAQGIVSEIQSAYGREGKSEEGEIERFTSYDLLVIDEADVKRDNPNASLLFTEVINRRYISGKPVVVITNQAMENLEQYVGDRVYSRLHENGFICSFDWPDFRRGATR